MEQVSARFVAAAGDLGFVPPPSPLRTKLLVGPQATSLYTQSVEGVPIGPVVAWLSEMQPRRIEFGARNVQRSEYRPTPQKWRDLFATVTVDLVWLQPDGVAKVAVTGPRGSVQALAAKLRDDAPLVRMAQIVHAEKQKTLLTDSQDEALRAAVATGYYKIPRPLNLHDLANMFGVTAASLSERLRRAEGRIITRWVEGGFADEGTTFGTLPGLSTELGWSPLVADMVDG